MTLQREQIVECACELFVAGGLEGLSMRKLARRLGVTAPALYRHYESKDRLILEVIGEAYKTFAQYLMRALEGNTPEERFSLTGRSYLAFALEHPEFYEVLHISPSRLGLDKLPPEAASHACTAGQFLVDRVREGMQSGMLKEGDAQAVARTIWAHAHGLISIHRRGLLRMSDAEFRSFFLESGWRLMGGIGKKDFVTRKDREAREAILKEKEETSTAS